MAASESAASTSYSQVAAGLGRQSTQSQFFLPPQFFSSNPLDRGVFDAKRGFADLSNESLEVCLVVVAGRELCVNEGPDDTMELQVLLLNINDQQLDLQSDSIAFLWLREDESPEDAPRLPLYLLGQDAAGRFTFALDISGPWKAAFLEYLHNMCGLDVLMEDLRAIMPSLSHDAVAIAGQAAALSQWHQAHRYCHRCGTQTVTTEGGLRRRCQKDHKMYPRTDPVVIMLLESPDGRRALLGRSRKFTPGMYTCLSGFIDQCESIEEAVRREVLEEAKVVVADVQIVGTQPWPIGRYGSCELMLGCMAKAMSYEIMINSGEMEDVQWYERSELQAAVALYDEMQDQPVSELQQRAMDTIGFFIPPPFAIAHHLIRAWAHHTGPWFPPVTPPSSTNGRLPQPTINHLNNHNNVGGGLGLGAGAHGGRAAAGLHVGAGNLADTDDESAGVRTDTNLTGHLDMPSSSGLVKRTNTPSNL